MRTKRTVILLSVALLGASFAASGQSAESMISRLHVADVPVYPLTHHLEDPMAAFPESFPMPVALYWSSQAENPLAMIHALR